MDRRPVLGWLQSWPAIALLLMTLLGIYQRTAPLENRRPVADREASVAPSSSIVQSVELKPWQDPLEAIPNGLREAANTPALIKLADDQFASIVEKLRLDQPVHGATAVPHQPDRINKNLWATYDARTQIIFIPVDDERTTEVREVRLRRRQAVIAALRASGMVAESSRMNYLPIRNWYSPASNSQDTGPKLPPLSLNPIAFEWYQTDPLLPATNRRTGTRQALIVWIPSKAFGDELLDGLDCFMKQLRCQSVTRGVSLQDQLEEHDLHLTLLGPESSSTLDGMLRWTDRNYVRQKTASTPDSFLQWLHILSPATTYDTELTLEELRRTAEVNITISPSAAADLKSIYNTEQSLLSKAGVKFQRTIGRDSALAGQLIHELELRGVNLIPKTRVATRSESARNPAELQSLDDIALVSESNTLYGRSFPVTFAAAMLSHGNVERDSDVHQQLVKFLVKGDVPRNLRNYSYIRQVDGSRSIDTTSRKPADGINSNLNVSGTSAYPEAPFGDGQLDSIRRLALQLADEYRDGNVKGKRLKAIGVIGSDVYDKLLILQALRQVFPNVIFFTTDLDARLFQTENLPWTRNLLVASHFGLSLNEQYQRGLLDADTPAFRDSYQSSYFFALRYQLGLPIPANGASDGGYWGKDELQSLIPQSRIFEIGREQALDLTGARPDVSAANRLHPPSHRYSITDVFYKLIVYAVALACLTVICLYTLVDFENIVLIERDANARRRLSTLAWWIIIVALVAGILTTLIIYDNYRPNGERWSLNSGTSVWPCLVLRIAATFLAGFFTWKILQQHRDRSLTSFMARELQVRRPQTQSSRRHRIHNSPPLKILIGAYFRLPAERFRSLFALGNRPHTDNETDPKLHEINPLSTQTLTEVSVQRCWRLYQRDTHPVLMVIRAAAMALIMGIAHKAFAVFATESHPSFRGELNQYVCTLITYGSDMAVAFLAFIVVDSTLNVCELVKRITRGRSTWPKAIKDQYANPVGNDSAVMEVLDVRFVASITEQVGRQVYYPFFALMFVIIARLGLFDASSWTPPLIITYSLIFLSVPACIFILRRAAARGRDDSVRALRAAIEQSRSEKETTTSLSELLKEIQETKRGAFSPLLDDPFFAALLLPSGGFTAVGFIERWLS